MIALINIGSSEHPKLTKVKIIVKDAVYSPGYYLAHYLDTEQKPLSFHRSAVQQWWPEKTDGPEVWQAFLDTVYK